MAGEDGLLPLLKEQAEAYKKKSDGPVEAMLDKVMPRFLDAWQAEADLKTYRQAVAEEIVFGVSQGETL